PDIDDAELAVRDRLAEAGEQQRRRDREVEREVPNQEGRSRLEMDCDDDRETDAERERVRKPAADKGARDVVEVSDPGLVHRDERDREGDEVRRDESHEVAPSGHAGDLLRAPYHASRATIAKAGMSRR